MVPSRVLSPRNSPLAEMQSPFILPHEKHLTGDKMLNWAFYPLIYGAMRVLRRSQNENTGSHNDAVPCFRVRESKESGGKPTGYLPPSPFPTLITELIRDSPSLYTAIVSSSSTMSSGRRNARDAVQGFLCICIRASFHQEKGWCLGNFLNVPQFVITNYQSTTRHFLISKTHHTQWCDHTVFMTIC